MLYIRDNGTVIRYTKVNRFNIVSMIQTTEASSNVKFLKVCDDGKLVEILCFWTLYIVLSLSKNRPVYFSKHKVSVMESYSVLR
jgi:hypothetical protein